MTGPRVSVRQSGDTLSDLEREFEAQRRPASAPDEPSDLEREYEAQRAAAAPPATAPASPPARRPIVPPVLAARDATAAPVTARERYRPGPVERAGNMVGQFASDVRHHPGEVAAGLALAPLKSLADAVLAPTIGDRRRDPRLSKGGNSQGLTPQQIAAQLEQPYDAEHGAVTRSQRAMGAAQTVANIAFPGIESAASAAATRAGMSKVLSKALGMSAASVPAGVAYSPEDPIAGALAGGVLGAALGVAGEGVGRGAGAAANAGRAVGEAGRAVSRDVRSSLAALEARRSARRNVTQAGEPVLTDAQLDALPTLDEVHGAIADLTAEHQTTTDPMVRGELESRLSLLEGMRRQLTGEAEPEVAMADATRRARAAGVRSLDDAVSADRPTEVEAAGPTDGVPPITQAPARQAGVEIDAAKAAAPLPLPESLARFGEAMHHETNIDRALALLGSVHEDLSGRDLFLSNVPELAKGQGNNRGVHFEFDPAKLRGQEHTAKPGLALTRTQGASEFIARNNPQSAYTDAVRAIVVEPDAFASVPGYAKRFHDVVLPEMERQGWTTEKFPNGSVRYSRPDVSSRTPLRGAQDPAGATEPPVEASTRPPTRERAVMVVDEDGVKRHANARTSSGARRPVEKVSTDGLLQDLLDLEQKRADAESRAIYEVREDKSFATSGIPQIVSTKSKSGGPSMQAKASRNLEDFTRATDEIHAALEARGLSLEDIFDRTEDLRVRNAERAGLEGDYDASRVRRDVLVDDETGQPLFAPAQGGGSRPRYSPAERDLFGEAVPERDGGQGSMFGEGEGTASSRSLRQTEAAARAELDRLTTAQRLETDPAAARARAGRIAELQRLVNRGEKIAPDELANRATAEQEAPTRQPGDGPDQTALFSPLSDMLSPLGKKIRSASGQLLPVKQASRVQSLRSISAALADGVGVPLREGRFRAAQRKAVGVFFPHSEVARIVRMDKIDTAAHEIGHYISKEHLRNPTRKGAAGRGAASLPLAARRELVQMGKDLYGSRKPNGGYGEEGIAQWARFYVTEHARLATDAPQFSQWMEANVLPKEPALQQALDVARQMYEDHAAAPATSRVDAMLSVNDQSRLASGLRHIDTPEKRAWWARKLMAWSLDDLNEFQLAVKELGGASSPTKDAYVLARLSRGAAGAAEEMLERGVSIDGQRISPSVEEVLESLRPDELQPFRRYLVAERAIELAGRGVDSGISLADAQELVQQYGGQFRDRARQLWAVSASLIDYRVAKGMLTQAEGAAIKAGNQRRVGFFRVFEDTETATGRTSGKLFGRNSSGVQRAVGSSRQIIDPLESIITDVYKTVEQAHAHEAALTLYRHAIETEGGGRVAELVPAPQIPVEIPLERVKQQLADLGIDASDADLSGVLRSFQDATQAGPREVKDMIIPVILDGERKWLAIKDAQLYEALRGLGSQQLPAWARILGAPTRVLRAGATLTAEFIARNPTRDAFTAAVFSQGPTRLPGYLAAEGLFHLAKQDDLFQRWRLAGGDNAAQLGLDRAQVQKNLKQLTRSTHGKAIDLVVHPIDALRMVSSVMENATRLGEFAAVERKGRAAGLGRADADAAAAFASRDVTIDFSKAGAVGRQVNQLVSFFNANLQGTAKLMHELRTRPGTVVPRMAAFVTMPSIALYLLQRDDPAYQEVPQWQKDVAWIVIQRDERGKLEHIWRIPKPPELGILFGTTFERALQFIDTHDPHAIDSMAGDILDVLNPAHMPDALRPAVEWWANKSMFRGRPIVPTGMERLPAAEQSTRYTGEAARQVGSLFDLSPAKIESTVTTSAGGLGRLGLQGADAVVRKARSLTHMAPLAGADAHTGDPLTRTPVVRGFTVRHPGNDAESVQRTYEDYREAEGHRLAWRKRLTAGDREGAARYLAAHRDQITSVLPASENGGTPGELRALYGALTNLQRQSAKAAKLIRDDPKRLEQAQAALAEQQVRLARAYRDRRYGQP